MTALRLFVEQGQKRIFAGAVDWPGLDRSGRTEDEAIEAVIKASSRYRDALGATASDLTIPTTTDDVDIVERVTGTASTDFGIPDIGPRADADPIDDTATERLLSILDASWRAFHDAAEAAAALTLRTGPRGGGRQVNAMVEHVLGAQAAYVREIGGSVKGLPSGSDAGTRLALERAAVDAWRALARGEAPPPSARRKNPYWTPRYFVRRSAWHAFDHAWEIEDRREPA